VAPLLELWGFGPYGARSTWPTETELATARTRVGWRQLEVRLDPPALRKTIPGGAADFSSIAKGFAVDELSRRLVALGAANHLVQIGGDLRAAGPGPEGAGWPVGIETPTTPAHGLVRVVALRDRALSTSGNHRNQLTLAGRVVGHLLDPRSGRPAQGPLAAVSVIADECATSSALATGLFVLGAEAGPALAGQERLAALFLIREGAALRPQATPAFDALAP
jgi:thiamine biosynthesis lipoprotein